MATHRISGEFTADMAEMDGTPEQSAEILQDLMYERFGYLKFFSVFIDPKNCAEVNDEGMTRYFVVMTDDDAVEQIYTFWADDAAHAVEQAELAEPDLRVTSCMEEN